MSTAHISFASSSESSPHVVGPACSKHLAGNSFGVFIDLRTCVLAGRCIREDTGAGHCIIPTQSPGSGTQKSFHV